MSSITWPPCRLKKRPLASKLTFTEKEKEYISILISEDHCDNKDTLLRPLLYKQCNTDIGYYSCT